MLDERSPEVPPRRSVLFVPGSNERAQAKAATLAADTIVIDLEDSVAPAEKSAARQRAERSIADGAYGHREVVLRINGLGTRWCPDDLDTVATTAPDAVLVPKVTQADDVRAVERALTELDVPADTHIWAMLESSRAVLEAPSISAASERLTVLVMGTNDLAEDLRAEHVPGRWPLLTALSLSVLAARAAGKFILDSVFVDLEDPDGFVAECHQGRALGFDGKTLIHPRQVDPCNRAFTPDAGEIQHAREIIAAFEDAEATGAGVATVHGRMIERLHVDAARRTLARAAPDPASEL